MDKRIGFIGVVLEDLSRAGEVNKIVGDSQALILGRIGVPDHDNDMGVIGLIVRGGDTEISRLTSRLGNMKGVLVKSAMTQKTIKGDDIE